MIYKISFACFHKPLLSQAKNFVKIFLQLARKTTYM